MATKQRTCDGDQPNPIPKTERNKEEAKERAAADAKRKREGSVSNIVVSTLGRLSQQQRMTCSEVGKGRYRINLLERKSGTESEILEETHIIHSWMVWSDGIKVDKAVGDVPLTRI